MRNSRSRREARKQAVGALFLLPSLLGVVLFLLLPFADVARRSFFSALGGRFVGLGNYRSVLQNDAFRLAAKNTGRFLGVSLPLLLLLSLFLALLLYGLPGGLSGFFKTSFLLPMAIPAASVVLVWQALFHQKGMLNGLLSALGLPRQAWMDSGLAFWVMTLSFLWKNLGCDVILWLAGLFGINPEILEAARVDGAGWLHTFWYVTLPNLLPCLYTVCVLSLINAFKVFREAYLAAGEYPHDSMYLLQHLFNNWFRDLGMDNLSAGAVLVAIGAGALIAALRLTAGKEEE